MYNDTFLQKNKHFPCEYISSIPRAVENNYFITIHEHRKGEMIGQANGIRFYLKPYNYESARFNINDTIIDFDSFILKIETMFSTLHYLNKKPTRALNMYLILKHIADKGRYVFNVKEMFIRARKFQYKPSLVEFKTRDYFILEELSFKKNIDFLNAISEARKVVNRKYNLQNLLKIVLSMMII